MQVGASTLKRLRFSGKICLTAAVHKLLVSTMSAPQIRFYEIDLYRFLSAFFIVIFHYTYTGFMEGYAPVANFEQTREWSRYAFVGINFFFVISGFVIYMSIGSGSPLKFIASRIARLFPAYWVAVILTSLITIGVGSQTFSVGWAQFFANLTMLHTAMGYPSVDGAYWTLFLELQFYAVILLLLSVGGQRHIQHLLLVTLASSLFSLFQPWAQTQNMWVLIFPHWSGYFAAGIVFYLIRQQGLNTYRGLLLLLSFAFVIKQSMLFADLMSVWFGIEFNSQVMAWLNVGFFLLMSMTAFAKNNPLRVRQFFYLGVLTYPLYLIHQHIGFIIFDRFATPDDIELWLLACVIIMLISAWAIWYAIERPLAGKLKQAVLKGLAKLSTSPKATNTVADK